MNQAWTYTATDRDEIMAYISELQKKLLKSLLHKDHLLFVKLRDESDTALTISTGFKNGESLEAV